MKLVYRIVLRLSAWLLVLIAAWAVVFSFIVTAEIDGRTDDALEDYAYHLVQRVLAGEELPAGDNGTSNTYQLTEVTPEWAAGREAVSYTDEEMWIAPRHRTDPVRVMRTIFADPGGRTYELTVAAPTYEKQDLRRRILWWTLILYGLLLGVVVTANALVIRRSFRPLYDLLEWLDGVKFGSEVPPLEMRTDVGEFRRLGEATMRAARRSKEMFDQQRLFTGNAAHELQTPVAVCRGRLEMLAGDPLLTESQLAQIGSVMGTLDRLAALNRSLLMLARIDNHSFEETSLTDAGEIIRRFAEDYAEVWAHRGLAIDIKEEGYDATGAGGSGDRHPDGHGGGAFVVEMNETLAGVLWGNLLRNAFVHTPAGGSIEVTVSARGVSIANTAAAGGVAGVDVDVDVGNSANDIAANNNSTPQPLDPDVVFRRFYRGSDAGAASITDNSPGANAGVGSGSGSGSDTSTSTSTGTGLGLALVESICRLYGLEVSYRFDGKNHIFTITAP